MSKFKLLLRRGEMTLRVISYFLLLLVPSVSVGSTDNSSSAANPLHFKHRNGEIIEAEVSAQGFSRVTLSGGMIFEVIGDESNYQLYSDQLGSNIFIQPRLPAGKSFALSLIGNRAQVIDMRLTVKDTESSVIIIDPDSGEGRAGEQMKGDTSLLKEEILMLRNMKLGRKAKYYVVASNSAIPRERLAGSLSETRVIKKAIYRFEDLTGVILEVRNNSKQGLILKEEDFNRLFCGSRVVHIANARPASKAITEVFVVTREDDKC